MATANSTRARGIKIDLTLWAHIATGPRELLVQHGFALDAPFPGDSGVKKTVCNSQDSLGRGIHIRRCSKTRFCVYREFNAEEKAANQKREDRKNEIEYALKQVEAWPKSAGAFREYAHEMAGFGLRLIERGIRDGERGGYRYDDDTILRFQILADQLRGLLDTGTVVKDLVLREQHTPACIAKTVRAVDAAKLDKTFQQFLGDVAK